MGVLSIHIWSHLSAKTTNLSLVSALVRRSCTCELHNSLRVQDSRLRSSGYPEELLNRTKRLLLNFKSPEEVDVEGERKKFVSVPYAHAISSMLSKSAKTYNISVATSYDNKIRSSMLTKQKREFKCSDTHKDVDVFDCSSGVVYEIAFSCGNKYIGESGRCANSRLKEHQEILKRKKHTAPLSHM